MHATCYDANRTLTRGVGWLDSPHDSPHEACQCGIYAYHSPGPRSWFGEAYWCEGVVSAWGRIVVHGDGFRAEHARVEALAVPPNAVAYGAAAVHDAAARLDVPVIEHGELEGFAAGLGGGGPARERGGRPRCGPAHDRGGLAARAICRKVGVSLGRRSRVPRAASPG